MKNAAQMMKVSVSFSHTFEQEIRFPLQILVKGKIDNKYENKLVFSALMPVVVIVGELGFIHLGRVMSYVLYTCILKTHLMCFILNNHFLYYYFFYEQMTTFVHICSYLLLIPALSRPISIINMNKYLLSMRQKGV